MTNTDKPKPADDTPGGPIDPDMGGTGPTNPDPPPPPPKAAPKPADDTPGDPTDPDGLA